MKKTNNLIKELDKMTSDWPHSAKPRIDVTLTDKEYLNISDELDSIGHSIKDFPYPAADVFITIGEQYGISIMTHYAYEHGTNNK